MDAGPWDLNQRSCHPAKFYRIQAFNARHFSQKKKDVKIMGVMPAYSAAAAFCFGRIRITSGALCSTMVASHIYQQIKGGYNYGRTKIILFAGSPVCI